MDNFPDDMIMQNIAMENRFSETAFTVKTEDKYDLRWFTPGGEIDLCGHATLAAAFVLFNYYETQAEEITFSTMSGDLIVKKYDNRYEMQFPAYELKQIPVTQEMEDAFGAKPLEAWLGRDLLCVFENEETVHGMDPDQEKLTGLPGLLQHATSKGRDYDCVSRSFAPKLSVPEDPVCGSGHCHIVPYWSHKIGNSVIAYQASQRGGVLYCRLDGENVYLGGEAAIFAIAELQI